MSLSSSNEDGLTSDTLLFVNHDVAIEQPDIAIAPSIGQHMLNYTVACFVLLVLLIPFAIFAILIKFDSPGPVFFRQPRIGYRNQVFYIWKFRSMYADRSDLAGARLTERNDPRITRVGAWLREWSLDELPQVFNVFAGEMALVGPRPHALEAKAGNMLYAQAVPGYHLRHRVLPGISGWAQVHGWRGETIKTHQIEQRVRYDLEYIDRQSLWFDLRILALTVVSVVRQKDNVF
jgi:lipopolysaccharide/colanic/teichoic acid biosynthesis glycosyltransferase